MDETQCVDPSVYRKIISKRTSNQLEEEEHGLGREE